MNLFHKFKMPRLRMPSLYADKNAPRKSPNYLIWAFLLPFLGMLAVMVLARSEPFGSQKSMLYSDMYHQYYPFFVNFRKRLLAGESLLYNWDIGMGIDYLGLISYYLGSPLNLLSVFVPADYTLEFFSLLAPIKLGLAGLCFGYFLKKTFDRNDFSIAVFGGFYGLCAWALGYHWNIMWLDSFAILPLVVLGTISLLRDKKFILYTISLALAVVVNYYIGLFVCIFVLLIFICYEICRFQSLKRFAMDLGRIALFSVLAIGMTLFLELPALAALQNTHSSVNQFPENFGLNIVDSDICAQAVKAWSALKSAKEAGEGFFTQTGLFFTALGKSFAPILEGMRQAAGNISGGNDLTLKEGLPNLYCGIGTLLLSFLFLTAKQVKLRDKICSVCMLVFMLLSILIRQLDYIWHGFHFTNMIPYRFTFLFSFVMLYMAYRAWLVWDQFKLWQFIVAGVLSLGVLMCSDNRFSFVYLSFNVSILLLFLGIFIYMIVDRHLDHKAKEPLPILVMDRRENARVKYGTLALVLVMGLEMVLNVANFGVRFTFTYSSAYPKQHENVSDVVDYIDSKTGENEFFRTEVTHEQTLNDAALNNYTGISTFTSSANVRVTEFMKGLGYAAANAYNRYLFEESSPVSAMFLNLKYLIERNENDLEENNYLNLVHTFGKVHLLENNAYLPLGFLANSELAQWDPNADVHPFTKQNQIFSMATGIQENVWSYMGKNQLTIKPSDVTLTHTDENGKSGYVASSSGGIVRYMYQINREGLLCLRATASQRTNFTVYQNGRELYSDTISPYGTYAVGQVQIGDTVIVDVKCEADSTGSVSFYPAVLNEEVFRQGYEILAESTMELTKFSDTKVEGTIDCNRDGLLYTSIPYDGNWILTVDGKRTEPVLIGNCMQGVYLSEGTHTIRFTYHNSAFTAGLIFSGLCILLFVTLILVSKGPGKVVATEEPAPEPPIENES